MRKFCAITLLLLGLATTAFAQSGTVYQAPWAQIGASVTLSASNSSSRVLLGWVAVQPTLAPPSVWVHNGGSVDVYVNVGGSSIVATTGGTLVAAGGDALIALNGSQYLAGITASSTATLTIATGVGSPLAKGGGGGGGGTTSIAIGSTPITGGTPNGLLYDSAGTVGNLATSASGVLVTSGASVPSISQTLPNGIVATTQASGDNSTKVATTAFVTTALVGVNPAVAVQAGTTAAADTSGFTYSNGVGGIGATFTGSVNTAVTIDGYTFTAVGQRLLVKNDTQSPSGAFNGVYSLTQLQTSLLAPIFTRATDYNQPSDINNTGAIPVINGTVNGTTQWVITSSVTTVGTDPLTYAQFSQNPAKVAITGGTINGTIIGGSTPAAGTFTALTGTSGSLTGLGTLAIRDTSAAFDVTLAATSSTALSAGRALTIDMKNVAHTLAFGSTANTITFPSAASYTVIGTGDTGTVTNTMLAGSIDLGTKMTGTLANGSVGATPLAAGGSASLTAPREYYECTGTCTITLPTPAAGYEFCVRNANNVATVITFAGIASVQFEVQAQTSYKAANTSIASAGAVTDKACWIGKDATHYDVGTMVGTWS